MPMVPLDKVAAMSSPPPVVLEPSPSDELFGEGLVGQGGFSHLFGNSSDGVVLCDENDTVLRVNPSFCRLFGYWSEECIGASINGLVAGDVPDVLEEALEVDRILREKGHYMVDGIRLCKDGSRIPVEVRCVSFSSSRGRCNFTIYRDLSDRREKAQKLDYLLGLENLLLSVSRDLVFSDDLDSNLRDALERICVFFGADRSYLFLYDEDKREMSLAYEWCSEGIPELSLRLTKVTPCERPWWFSRLEKGDPILVGAVDQLPPEAAQEKVEFHKQGAGSFLTLPVYMGNSLGGALGLDNIRCRDFWSEEHVKDLSLFADLLGRVLYQERVHKRLVLDLAERMCLEERARFDEERLSLALEASGNGLWDLDLTTGSIEMSESTLHFLGYESGEIDLSLDACKDSIHPDDRSKAGQAFADHLAGHSSFFEERFRLRNRSGDYIWFQVRGKVVGRDEAGRPLRLAGLIADETERHHIEEVLEQSLNRVNHLLEGTIDVISRLVESRDPYTAGHQKRVARLAGAVARRMGISRERVKGIQVAGLVHDIGKVCVPSDILSKPGKLTFLEFDLIRDHPSRGALILGQVDFPWPVRDIVEQHHERLDGSGYPRGLMGGEILQEAQIMAVADVVEAMISHRPYRPALGLDAALGEIRQGRGIIYDPAAVDACEAVFEEGFFFEA